MKMPWFKGKRVSPPPAEEARPLPVKEAWIIAVEEKDGSTYPMKVECMALDGTYKPYGLFMPVTEDGYAAVRIEGGMSVAFGKAQFVDSPDAPQPDGLYKTRCRLCKITFKNDLKSGKCLSCGTALDSI